MGPSLRHCRCVRCFIPTTRSEIDTDTVTFVPTHIKFPLVNIIDYLKQTATDIVVLLQNLPHPLAPSLQAGSDIHNAIYVLAALLNNTKSTETHLTNARRQTFGPSQDISTTLTPLKPISLPAPLQGCCHLKHSHRHRHYHPNFSLIRFHQLQGCNCTLLPTPLPSSLRYDQSNRYHLQLHRIVLNFCTSMTTMDPNNLSIPY